MDASKRYASLRVALFVLSGIGLIFFIAAFTIIKWSTYEARHEGLWQIGYDNGKGMTFAQWPDHLKSGLLKASQIFACFGLAFYILFAVASALTIFWTNNWKFARGIKASTVVFSAAAAISIAISLILYKEDREQAGSSLSVCWFLALVSAILAAIAAPFYLIDAIRTVKPKEENRKVMGNIAPVSTMESFQPTSSTSGKQNALQRESAFIHQPGERIAMKNGFRWYRTLTYLYLHRPPTRSVTTRCTDDSSLPTVS